MGGMGAAATMVVTRRRVLAGRPDAQAFEHYLAAHPGAIALWLGGHTR